MVAAGTDSVDFVGLLVEASGSGEDDVASRCCQILMAVNADVVASQLFGLLAAADGAVKMLLLDHD